MTLSFSFWQRNLPIVSIQQQNDLKMIPRFFLFLFLGEEKRESLPRRMWREAKYRAALPWLKTGTLGCHLMEDESIFPQYLTLSRKVSRTFTPSIIKPLISKKTVSWHGLELALSSFRRPASVVQSRYLIAGPIVVHTLPWDLTPQPSGH